MNSCHDHISEGSQQNNHLRMAPAMVLFLLAAFAISEAAAQEMASNSSITPGSSLTPANNSHWSSASGDFAFGFYQRGESYAVGIWFDKIQQKTVIWTARRDDPLLSRDAVLMFNGRLVLQQPGGQQITITDVFQRASSASMLNNGNFVLYNSESQIIWQSFDSPTDTILPGQSLRAGSQLVSSTSEAFHSSGRFFIVMQGDGNLVQYPMPSVISIAPKYAYWNSETFTAGNTTVLNLESTGWLYLQNRSGLVKNLTGQTMSGGPMYRATIDADGIFRLYSHSLNQDGNWSIQWNASSTSCDPIALCGFNGYCMLAEGNPVCSCLPGFDFVDQNRKSLGCERSVSLDGCMSKNNSFSIRRVDDVMFAEDTYSSVQSASSEACQDECSRDCSCEVAFYSEQECRKQKLPFISGRSLARLTTTVFVKVSSGDSRTKMEVIKERKKDLEMGILIIGSVCLTLGLLFLAISGAIVYRHRIWEYRKVSNLDNDQLLADVTLRSFTYDELREATNNFSFEIGRGAFGTVFKGLIYNGRRVVAIKRLEKVVTEGEREFQNEMRVIGRTHHKCLVRLLGYCHDGTNRLLVYEYMRNGSLSGFLFRTERRPAWEERIEIALTIARGILYLHEECETQIIHCDIKPENILMDENECAKIADFGLSKLLMPDQSRTNTGMRGTRGYVAPEWHKNLPITVKVDVYSFGIVLLEIICCRRNVDNELPENQAVLANWVYDCFEANELDKLIRNEQVEMSQLERMVKLGLWCIQDEPSIRPSMKKVVLMLEGTIDIPSPPCPSFASSSSN